MYYYYMKEYITKIVAGEAKGKKYTAYVKNRTTKKIRKIHFGAKGYAQYKDSTSLKLYSDKDHGDSKRRKNYFKRHSGTPFKSRAIKLEKQKSDNYWTAKLLSHTWLW